MAFDTPSWILNVNHEGDNLPSTEGCCESPAMAILPTAARLIWDSAERLARILPLVTELHSMISPRADGGSELRLTGFFVSRCLVDFSFSLDLVRPAESIPGQEAVFLQIEAPFECILDGTTFHFDPGHDLVGLGRALTLFRRTVAAAYIGEDGSLTIAFDDHATLQVPSRPTYESWNLNERGGVLIVSGPGSRVSVFPPPSAPSQ